MRVSVFGLGYVGSVTAACLAKAGHEVIGVDLSQEKIAMVNDAVPPVVEEGLGELLAEVVWSKRLRATASAEEAVKNSDLAFVSVGTPSRSNGQLDVTALERVAENIGKALAGRDAPFTAVLRSTVLPGTTEQIFIPALRAGAGRDLGDSLSVAVNPEFMREGSALKDFAHPPLTLVGSEDAATAASLRSLYAGVDAPFVHVPVKTAEMVKYVSNTFHALKICFANEIGNICAALGVDAQEIMRIFLMDRKLNVSEAYLRPGFAFGGSCLPKDVRALVYAARSADASTPLLASILPSNEGEIRRAVEAVLATRKRRVGIAGLSFKPATDDLRESPMVALAETLIGKGCDVRILDGNVSLARLIGANRRYIEEEIPHISSLMCDDAEALLAHAEVLVIGNSGEEAASVLAAATSKHVVIDLTRGALKKDSKGAIVTMQSVTARAREMDPVLKLQAHGAPAGAMTAGASEDVEIRRHEGCDAMLALRPALAAGGLLPAPLAGMDPEFLAAGFEGKTPGAMVAYAAGRPVGYMTYALQKIEFRPPFGGLGIGRFPCRQLRLFGYAGRDQALAPILERFFRSLLDGAPWHVSQIFELPLENPLAEYITGAPFGSGRSYSLASSVYETFQVGIAESFETYLKNQFTKKTRYNLKREVRLLEDSAPGEVTLKVYHTPGQVTDFLRDGAAVASRCYKWQGGPNPMEATSFQVRKASHLAARGRWRGYVLFIRDVPVAFCETTLRWGELYVEIVGHDARFMKLNPGKVLLYKIFEDLHLRRIVEQLNLGTGTAEYRRVFATSSRRVVDVNLYRNRLYPQFLRAIAATADASYRQLHPLICRCAPPIKRILRRRGVGLTGRPGDDHELSFKR